MKTQYLLISLLALLAASEASIADETNFGSKKPDINQVIDALSPAANSPVEPGHDATSAPEVGTRGLDMSIIQNTPSITKKKLKKTIQKAVQKIPAEAALSMEIFFNYNSAELTEAAKDYLKPVGEALVSDKLQGLSFVVEGHTDAVGGATYNQVLSEQRAAAVKKYFIETFHIEPNRLDIVGKGKSGLLDPKNPESEVNRRVRIVAKR